MSTPKQYSGLASLFVAARTVLANAAMLDAQRMANETPFFITHSPITTKRTLAQYLGDMGASVVLTARYGRMYDDQGYEPRHYDTILVVNGEEWEYPQWDRWSSDEDANGLQTRFGPDAWDWFEDIEFLGGSSIGENMVYLASSLDDDTEYENWWTVSFTCVGGVVTKVTVEFVGDPE